MPMSQTDEILDSITLDNIDDAMLFYSHILEKIMQKKKKYQHNEMILINQLKKLDIKKEMKRLISSMESDSMSDSMSETSDSD